jgi:hypothetical protein
MSYCSYCPLDVFHSIFCSCKVNLDRALHEQVSALAVLNNNDNLHSVYFNILSMIDPIPLPTVDCQRERSRVKFKERKIYNSAHGT